MSTSCTSLLVAVSLGLSMPSAAQEPLDLWTGDEVDDLYGFALRPAGDVDGDGAPDFVVGAPTETIAGEDRGSVSVVSGATRAVIHRWEGIRHDDFFGGAVDGAGDVDGDGLADVIVGAPQTGGPVLNPGRAQVYSGATGAELATLTGTSGAVDLFGSRVGGIGDVDGDGRGDVYVREQRITISVSIRLNVYSGATGNLLWFVESPPGDSGFALAVAPIDDRDGDGAPELLVADPDYFVSSPTVRGRVQILSGRTGALLDVLEGGAQTFDFATSLAGLGDVDADGVDDFVVGSDASSFGRVQVVSGATLTNLWARDSLTDSELGASVALAGDFDGDGTPDCVVGSPSLDGGGTVDGGGVHVFAGDDGTSLLFVEGRLLNGELGFAVAGAGDLDGDGRDDVLAARPEISNFPQSAGLVWAMGIDDGDGGWFDYCQAKASSSDCLATLSGSGSPSVGPVSGASDFTVTLSAAEGQRLGVFFSSSTTAIAGPFFGGTLCVSPPLARGAVFSTGGTPGSCDGSAALVVNDGDLLPPAGQGFDAGPGGTSWIQAWHRDPLLGDGFDVALSNALHVSWQ